MYTREHVKAKTLDYFNGDELATNVFITKYALRDKNNNILEENPDDMHKRLAKEFARIEKYFFDKHNRGNSLTYDEIYASLKNFKYIVPQGSPMMGIGNDYVNVSLSNCVVIESPKDSISSIIDAGKELANLFKRRCGVGLDISNLRPEDAAVNNSAKTTTGAWSFADFYSYVCRMIGQNGRRGALMVSIDIRHPDIEKFVTMKHDLTKVTGANVSVKITDDFMKAVENKQMFTLQFPVDSKNPAMTKEINANELWNLIVESATKTAEPGLLMWDNITSRLPANEYKDSGFKTLTTNPCGEIPLSAYDSCRLISINLKHFVENEFTSNALFNFNKFAKTVRKAMRMSDDLVQLEIEKLEKIVDVASDLDEKHMWGKLLHVCMKGRRTGLGTHGLADVMARLCIKYDDEKSIETAKKIYKILRDESYRESINLAQERGAFEAFNWNIEQGNEFIKELPDEIRNLLSKYGRRNISILTNAPTGSVSIMSQTSSGLEPVFRNSYVRRRKLSHNESNIAYDFVDELGDKWLEYTVYHQNVKDYIELNGIDKIENLPDFFTTSDQIDWQKRIKIQSTIQTNIDHSISSTINLPQNTSPEIVGKLYMEGWKQGLKGITVYVDGSRSGVLIEKNNKEAIFPQHEAPRRPKDLECDIHHTTIQGEKWTILVGLYDSKPYEIIGGLADFVEIPKKYNRGLLTKHTFKTRNRYDLKFGDNGSEIIIKDVVKVFDNPNHSAFTRMISLGLRHGAQINFVVEQLQKNKDHDMFSFSKCIARVLKNYIIDGTKVNGEKGCPECSLTTGLIYIEGCMTCQDCGFAKCG